MKKILAILLCAALLLPLFGCGNTGGNDLWDEASPETSAMFLYSFDKDGGRAGITFDQADEHAILDRLSAVKAVPVTDWTAEKVTLPVYGIEIGSKDGWGILAAWSNGYLILRDGSVYKFDFDFSALEKDYEWEQENRIIGSLSAMPCGRLLSEGPDGWVADHLSPAEELTPPKGISMVLNEQTSEKVTVKLSNRGDTEWMYGEYFSLQVLLNDGWYNVPVLDDKNYGFTDIGIILPAGESREESYSLSMYGTLPEGTYRLVVEGMSVEFSLPITGKSIVSITDQTGDRELNDAEEVFFEDETNRYIFGNPISQYIIVRYADGSEEDIKTALESGGAGIEDLDRFGIPYWAQSKDEVTCVVPRGNVLSIVDHSLDDPDRAFAMALEPFWEDDANVYSFPCIKSQFVTVYYDDGTEENVKSALQAGWVTMDDLDTFGILYLTEPKA